ncbi:MAG: peptidase MA domain-containing protein [Dehalococcoidaceae bacterium]|nr:peptidase MA domain-containing protein [Dehalococcoidaceae bacterium]
MIKAILTAGIGMFFVLSFVPAGLVNAETGLQVLDNRAVPEYPSYIIFRLEIDSSLGISDIRLNYRVDRDSFVDIVCDVKPDIAGTPVTANWIWDMNTTGNPPPGTVIDYWWKITDDNGNEYMTEERQVIFDDLMHQWQVIEEGNLALYWYNGTEAFARELMHAAQTALVQLENDTGAHLARPVDIYIYASSSDLQRAMVYVQDWAGGLAFTGYGVVSIGIAPSDMAWGKRAMVHELAHLVTYQMTSNPYNSIPVWLNEGLSMYAEGELESYSETMLRQAAASDSLISVQSLCSPFSAYADETYLSYAQSYSLVSYLIAEYGSDRVSELLEVFRNGSNYDGALLQVYGFDMDGLDEEWQEYVNNLYGAGGAGQMNLGLTFLIAVLAVSALIPFVLLARSRLVSR